MSKSIVIFSSDIIFAQLLKNLFFVDIQFQLFTFKIIVGQRLSNAKHAQTIPTALRTKVVDDFDF